MAVNYLIGIDIGSSVCKATVIDERGIAHTSAEKSYSTFSPSPGWYEQDAEDWYRTSCVTVKMCLERAGINGKDVAGLAIDGPAHAFALLDRRGEPLCRVIHWSDLRSVQQARFLEEEYGNEIFDLTLQRVSAASSLAQLLWIKENRADVWKSKHYLLVSKDYVRHKLTGSYDTDPYDAVGIQLYDVSEKSWSEKLLGAVGINVDMLPRVFKAEHISGSLKEEPARTMGLPAGVQVAVGSGDSAVETLSISATLAGDCIVKLGTSANVDIITESVHASPEFMTYPYLLQDKWISIAATNSGARTLRWFIEKITSFDTEKQADEDMYSDLLHHAASIEPGSAGLLYHPYLTGERSPYWNENLRGMFSGLRIDHDRYHFVRAIMEGVAYSLRDCFEVFVRKRAPVKKIHIIGGGSRSTLWCQIISDVLGKELSRSEKHGADIGSALIAGVATGVFSNLTSACGILQKKESRFSPVGKLHDLYDQYFNVYKECIELNSQIGKLLNTIVLRNKKSNCADKEEA